MTTGALDIYIVVGTSFGSEQNWTFSTKNLQTGQVTLDNFTGATARMVVSSGFFDPVDRLLLTTENGGLILGGATGVITPVITGEQSRELWEEYGSTLEPFGVYVQRQAYLLGPWDLHTTMLGGSPRRRLQGNCYLVPEA